MAEMPIYENLEKIAQLNTVWENLVLLLEQELDEEGIDWRTAVVVSGLHADGDYLYDAEGKLVAEDAGEYYISSAKEYMDQFFRVIHCSNLYFRTAEEGVFVRVVYELH